MGSDYECMELYFHSPVVLRCSHKGNFIKQGKYLKKIIYYCNGIIVIISICLKDVKRRSPRVLLRVYYFVFEINYKSFKRRCLCSQ
jgi:hypothetical protein